MDLKRQLKREKYLGGAVNLISFRPRSRQEITNYLNRKKATPKMVAIILGKLERLGYLDDAKFARWWLEQRLKFRPKGRVALMAELSAKGVDRETANQALAESNLKAAEPEAARRLLEKQWPKWRTLPPLKQKQKAYAYLARRGFSPEVIRALVATDLETE